MAIRRPSISSPEWYFQDFLYSEDAETQFRYVQVKWSGEPYTRVSQTFDYSNPPYPRGSQRGGDIVAQLDYSLSGKVVTITDWSINWQDEFPLRLAVNYLMECLYPYTQGYVAVVAGGEEYKPDGTPVPVASGEPHAFWVSERFQPLTNRPDDYLYRL
jgi:hypothetical protein